MVGIFGLITSLISIGAFIGWANAIGQYDHGWIGDNGMPIIPILAFIGFCLSLSGLIIAKNRGQKVTVSIIGLVISIIAIFLSIVSLMD